MADYYVLLPVINGSNIFGVVPIANGGTGATTALGASIALIPPSVVISGTNINWALGFVFNTVISGNTTFTFSNVKDGQTISVRITASGSFTATFPAGISYAGGQQTQTANGLDYYTFIANNGGIQCVQAQAFT